VGSGNTTTLYWPHATSDLHRHSFVVSAPATWNNIPASIRDSGTVDSFKTALKTHLFNSVYMPCHWQPSIGAFLFTFGDTWLQLRKSILIDWLIDWLTAQRTYDGVAMEWNDCKARGQRIFTKGRIACRSVIEDRIFAAYTAAIGFHSAAYVVYSDLQCS